MASTGLKHTSINSDWDFASDPNGRAYSAPQTLNWW